MLHYNKNSDLKRMLENLVDANRIVRGVFQDASELMRFSFDKSSEYDDNNYSDNVVLTSVNGHIVDYEGRYSDDEYYEGDDADTKSDSDLPRVDNEVIQCLMNVLHDISREYDYDHHDITRESFTEDNNRNDKEETKYLNSYLTKTKIEDKWFVKAHPKWAAYHAEDHGPLDSKIEAKVFCKVGRMQYAYMYAQATNAPLSEVIETFFTTHHLVDPNENDNAWLKKYLLFKNTLKKELVG